MNPLLRQVLVALEIGETAAANVAHQYHESMKGYRQARHDALDQDVRTIRAASEAVRAELARTQCRDDGRCQYAIDNGVEGAAACLKGKCVMPKEAGR